MSLAETLDGRITKIIEASPDRVIARVHVPLRPEQRDYVLSNLERGRVITDQFSTHAQLGLNQRLATLDEPTVRAGPSEEGTLLIDPSNFSLRQDKSAVSYNAIFEKYIPERFVTPSGEIVGLDDLLVEGTKVGKLYVANPELQIGAGELMDRSGRDFLFPGVRRLTGLGYESEVLRETVIHPDGTVEVPLLPFVHVPDRKLNSSQNLRRIIDKHVPRTDLWIFHPQHMVEKDVTDKRSRQDHDVSLFEGIPVKADSGVITHTTLFTGHNEVVILDENHSDARVATKYTNGAVAVELLPNGEPYVQGSISLRLFRQPGESTRTVHPMPGRGNVLEDFIKKSDLHAANQKRYSPEYLATLYETTGRGSFEQKIPANDVQRQGRLQAAIKKRKGSSLYLSHFPDNMLASNLTVAGPWLSSVTFRHAGFYNDHFSNQDFENMRGLAEHDIDLYWANPHLGKLMKFYGQFFVDMEKIPLFEEIYESRKIAAFYGSSGEADERIKKDIMESMEAYRDFHGGTAGVMTGGLGRNEQSVMSTMYRTARDLGFLCGCSAWDIPYEGLMDDADFIQLFQRRFLSVRQDVMDEASEVNIYHVGGFGTDLEGGIPQVKESLTINPNKPRIFVGDFYEKKRAWFEHIVQEGRGGPHTLDNVYFVPNGRDVAEVLRYHYQTMDKPILRTSE